MRSPQEDRTGKDDKNESGHRLGGPDPGCAHREQDIFRGKNYRHNLWTDCHAGRIKVPE